MSKNEPNSWNEYEKLVLHELQAHTRDLDKIRAELHNLNVELATLKIKSGFWGLLAGAVPVLIAVVLKML